MAKVTHEALPGRLISYRLSLLLAISLFTLTTGGLIIANSYVRSRQVVTEIASRLFREVSERTVGSTQARLAPAVPTVDLLRRRLESGLLSPDDSAVLAREFLAALQANPSFAWVSYGDAQGRFTGAYRAPDGTLRINHSERVGDHSHLLESRVDPDGRWTPIREDDTPFDPRTRPWYQLAANARARVWTPPYVFFDLGVPGVTCAQPTFAPDGSVRGVFTVDFDINGLSEYVSSLHPSPHARVFIFTRDGTLLAHPSVRVVSTVGHGGDGALLRLQDVKNTSVRAYLAEIQRRHGQLGRNTRAFDEDFSFVHHGDTFLASYNTFSIEPGVDWVVGAIAPQDDFMGEVHHSNRISLEISLVALALALVLAAVLAQRIAGPLASLAREMDEVGQFNVEGDDVKRSSFREIAMMNRSLLNMKKGLRSFANYVPRDLVRAVVASGQEARLGGKTRAMTVFFSDLAGFTTLAETMTPDDLVAFLGGYLDEMTREIATWHGTVDKFIGDGIMAFWGAPEENPDHAVLACEAALACDRRLRAMRAEGDVRQQGLFARIGIATGPVLVGNIGTPQRLNYTVMGDVVNLASRLEGLGKQYGVSILVSDETARAVRDRIVVRPVDVVAVKGRAQGAKVHELLARVADHDTAAERLALDCDAALTAYLARDFAGAEALYAAVLAVHPDDPVATRMRERARSWMASPPPADWNGIYVAKEK